jgi:hypothetical protein
MTESSRGIRDRAKRINHVFGGRYKSSLIKTETYFAQCLKYIYQNPVRAGMCSTVETYPWSTISADCYLRSKIRKIDSGHDCHVPNDPDELIKWLNMPLDALSERAIRNALKRSVFEIKADSRTRKMVDLQAGIWKRGDTEKQ